MLESVAGLTLSNVLLSALLAVLAWAVHRGGRYPAVAHLLWVAVLLKLITPPLVSVPLPSLLPPLTPLDAAALVPGTALPGEAGVTAGGAWPGGSPILREAVLLLLLTAWFAGSLFVLATSARRIRRFGRHLRHSTVPASPRLTWLAAEVGHELGLRSAPPIVVTRARISPMTWWSRGHLRLVLPAALLVRADAAELRWVLAHELGHVKRRDHLVRWLEWLVSVAFWWNPALWWARRNLRLDEEDACDALVLQRIHGAPRAYAGTLLRVVEILARPAGREPAVATGIDAARSLEHRLSAIMSGRTRKTAPRRLLAGLGLVTVALMAAGPGALSSSAAEAASSEADVGVANVVAGEDPSAVTEVERYVMVGATLRAQAHGTRTAYRGTAGRDVISGTDGADLLAGRGGADTIHGGAGNDRLFGGPGSDTIGGGAGDDTIVGGAGRDTIDGGAGDDTIEAWADGMADVIDCGAGNDRAVVDDSDEVTRCEDVVIREPA